MITTRRVGFVWKQLHDFNPNNFAVKLSYFFLCNATSRALTVCSARTVQAYVPRGVFSPPNAAAKRHRRKTERRLSLHDIYAVDGQQSDKRA